MQRADRGRATNWMALSFSAGSACFLVGPFPGYADLVGEAADAITFFVGSILFTIGGGLQTAAAFRDDSRPARWSAAIQSAGTVFFNVTTLRALSTAISNARYDQLVWRPDAFGSLCFLASGLIAYKASRRHGWLPMRGSSGWWQPAVNLLGCVFFGIAAIAGYVVPSTGSVLKLAAANWNTCLGAACFLACAVAALTSPQTTRRSSRSDDAPFGPERDVRHPA